jgi:hypothetical protein
MQAQTGAAIFLRALALFRPYRCFALRVRPLKLSTKPFRMGVPGAM